MRFVATTFTKVVGWKWIQGSEYFSNNLMVEF